MCSFPHPKFAKKHTAMPTNKNALTRYKFLDEMLSDRRHYYDIHDLTEKCNDKLFHAGLREVTQRCIEKDLNQMGYAPFYAEIERFVSKGRHCIRYADPSFSIFKKQLSDEESNLILEVLDTIGQFDGLAHFEWLERFKIGLGLKKRPKVISFSNNPYLTNSNLLGVLFDNTSNQVVVEMEYHTFSDATKKTIIFHPYLLKQYNNRWYILGAADTDRKILTFALDRIDKVTPLPDVKYIPCEENLSERFEDIVGVTLYEDRPIEHIVFWVSDQSKDYIDTKPIHGSQTPLHGDKSEQLSAQYPNLEGGAFFSIDCIPNYELTRELCSFGQDLIVLSPTTIQNEIFNRISSMLENYSNLRT